MLINSSQRKKIFALKTELRMSKDELYEVVFRISNQDHISKLTKSQAIDVIDSLEFQREIPSDHSNNKQQKYILGLMNDLGWNKARLAGFITKRFHVTCKEDKLFAWIDKKTASKLIEALKDMKQRGYSERI
jgi:hypothetical protein